MDYSYFLFYLSFTYFGVQYSTRILRAYTMTATNHDHDGHSNKKLSYCWETVRRESMPEIAEMDVEITT